MKRCGILQITILFMVFPLFSQTVNIPDAHFLHALIDLGVDLIIGHHPHVIQGMENYNGKEIYYSIGNFIFPDINIPNWNIKTKEEERKGLLICPF